MIEYYHWVWYLLGFMFVPRFTFMVLITVHFRDMVPMWLFVVGWIVALADFMEGD